MSNEAHLKKTLGPVSIWALGVGYVISGMYFGWNLGLAEGGPYGLLVATILITIMYVAFVLSYSELACSMPKAGGAFIYSSFALGPELGFVAGMAQCIEFVFAPPAIAAAIGAYFNMLNPNIPILPVAFGAYFLFTGLNIYGVKQSAIFEVFVTIMAVFELLLFAAVCFPHFSMTAFTKNPLPNGWIGVLPSIPYAIWFYLAIEGIANIAEETKDPQKDLSRGFSFAMATLVILTLVVFFASIGVDGWETIVYKAGTTETSDSPLPLALTKVVGTQSVFYEILIGVGLFGLVASFHGIILAAGRATFEFGRVGYAPPIIGYSHPKRETPVVALLINMVVGCIALLTGKTAEIITISVFGALTMYILSSLSVFYMRKKWPDLERPFKTPFYPIVPILSLILSVGSFFAVMYYNSKLAFIYFGLLIVGLIWLKLFVPVNVRDEAFGSMHKNETSNAVV